MGFEPGGLSDKLGNRYEGHWVAKQLLDLLDEKIRSVSIEAIGDDERGVDLWIEKKDDVRQAQQCKARNKSRESWSISDLKSRGVLSYLRFQLDRDPQHEFAFVSAVGAKLFRDICDYARRSDNNPDKFYKYKIQRAGKDIQTAYHQFCKALTLDSEQEIDRARAFGYLKRTYVILYPDDQNSWRDLLAWAGYLLTGNPETALSTLLSYAGNEDRFGSSIDTDELRNYLSELGIHPKRLAHDNRIAPAIEELQRQFEESIRPRLIGNKLIQREETKFLIEIVEGDRDVILHGAAGFGKTGVLYELTQYLRKENIPYLPIRLDRREPRGTAAQFGVDMGLPDSPAYSLTGIAGDCKCVLILDQLDAIRWTCAHSANAMDVCKELVRHLGSLRQGGKKISVVLSCRTFDLEHDPEIKSWLAGSAHPEFSKVEVKELTTETLQKVIGPSFGGMTDRQKRILASPQNLAIWTELKRTGGVPAFRSATELMRRFWENRREVLEKAGISPEQLDQVLTTLVNYMEGHGKISAPKRKVDRWQKVTKALCSFGILQESAGKITFCHQSYLDYLIADRLLRQIDEGTGNILDWLGPKEKQSLFRREQLRQALTMLSEESPQEFLKAVKQLIESDGVRFHLKHLVLELIGQVEDVGEELGEYCVALLEDNYWKEHLLETVFLVHPPYICLLLNKGTISEWLDSESEEKIDRALWLLRSVAEKIPDAVTAILEPFREREGDWSAWALNTICWRLDDDSHRMFQLRLRLARLGYVKDFVDWKSLCSKHPLRAIRLIEAVVSTWDTEKDDSEPNASQSSKRKRRLERWYDKDCEALNNVAKNYPTDTWDLLVLHIERLTAFKTEPYDHRLDRWMEDRISARHGHDTDIARGVVELVILAGRILAAEQPDEFIKRTAPLENSISPITQEILIEVYAHLPAARADDGIRWLLGDITRFRPGSGYSEPEWMPAMRLIKSLSPYCSDELFRKLEDAIVYYHSPDEKRLAEYYLKGWRDGYFGDYWGRAQYFLLPALYSKRVRPPTADLIRVLKRKFAYYPEERFLRTGRISGGCIGSKLDPSLEKISNLAWLSIVSNKKIQEQDNHKWIQVSQDRALTTSVRQFSDSLGKIAKRFPERFGQLALHFPDDVHPLYVSAILDGLGKKKPDSDITEEKKASWNPASVETVEAVLKRFQAGNDRETAMSFCRLISERADENWSDQTIERLIHYAKRHPDLEPGKLNMHCDKSADEASVDILYQNTINCVRGVVAEAFGQLLWSHTDWMGKFMSGIEALVNDPHPAVRMASIEALLPMLNIDEDQAVKWFCNACAGDLRVAASRRAVEFFNYTVQSHFEQIGPIIQKMVHSSIDDVAREGAMEVTARWLFHRFFKQELQECREGTTPQRKGVAQVASHFLHDKKYSARCQDLLLPLLNDPDKEVRSEIYNILRSTDFLNESTNEEFLEAYIRSKAFANNPDGFVYILEDFPGSLLPLSEAIFTICEVFSTTLKEKSRDVGSVIPHAVSGTSSILLRLYEQAQTAENAQIANRCLGIWDVLFENRVGIVRELTNAIEK